jgi:AbrB family looped-hinge helix DNA binding protein
LETVTVSPKYQIVIPKAIRADLKIKPGEKIVMIEKDGVIHLIKLGDLKKLRGKFKKLSTEGMRDESERFAE